jgi:isocitrate dehydrogenase kinase/phosphatase
LVSSAKGSTFVSQLKRIDFMAESKLKKYNVTYRADGEMKSDIWYAESPRDAKACAYDTYKLDYKKLRIINVEEIK